MKKALRIYLASSWRNEYQPTALAALRAVGHEVYDFRNPAPGNTGFGWKQCDPELKENLTADRMRRVLGHPVAQAGFDLDFGAMKWADVCVLLLPCGNSAHLEAGWFAGQGKQVVVFAPEIREPELMYKLFDHGFPTPLFGQYNEVTDYLSVVATGIERR